MTATMLNLIVKSTILSTLIVVAGLNETLLSLTGSVGAVVPIALWQVF